jgi:Tfp pilus assembly protein PilF
MTNVDDRTAPSRKLVLPVFVMCLATLWAYRESFFVPFVFDDIYLIVEGPAVRSFEAAVRQGGMRPVGMLTLAANYAVGGLKVSGYHAFNLLVHLSAGLVLFGIVRRTLLLKEGRELSDGLETHPTGVWLPAAVALIWLVHPLQTQSVTYIIQRFESLMGLFYLLCIYCVLRGSQSSRGWPWYAAATAACWLGMGTKEVMASAPLVVLLYDRIFLADSWRDVMRRRWGLYLGLLCSLIWLAIGLRPLFVAEVRQSAGLGVPNVTPWEYLSSQPGVILHYLRLSFVPYPLCLDYKWPVAQSPAEIYGLGAVIVALLLASIVALRFWPRVGFVGLSFFLILAPTSSIMPIADLAFEHRMYLPLAAVIILAVFGFRELAHAALGWEPARRNAFGGALVLVTLVLVGRTVSRNQDYLNPVQLWSKTIEVAPHNYRAHHNLGIYLQEQKRYGEALASYERAAQLNPNYFKVQNDWAVLLADMGKTSEAAEHYEQAIRLKPDYTKAYDNYGNLYARQGDFARAIPLYLQAIESDAKYAPAHLHLGVSRYEQGEFEAAVVSLRQTLRLDPDRHPAAMQLAWILATADSPEIRDRDEALELAEHVRQRLGERDYRVLDTLAAAYAANGRFEEAVAAAQRAYDLASFAGDADKTKAIQQRVKLYKQRQPFYISLR